MNLYNSSQLLQQCRKEIHEAVVNLKADYEDIILIANSIGAFFSMNANLDGLVQKAYFISRSWIWKS